MAAQVDVVAPVSDGTELLRRTRKPESQASILIERATAPQAQLLRLSHLFEYLSILYGVPEFVSAPYVALMLRQ